ncbi:hypothetical protein NBRC116594_04400 [Shimia sp. NS0008-38b]|uniref:hypothetical protein n=1 Tax=Shimia sp. NS0008-38b TaxID=3127653 RepID=UPI003103FCB1
MRSFVLALLSFSIIFQPVVLRADNRFITAESVRVESGEQVVTTSVIAGAETQTNEDGLLVLTGVLLLSDGSQSALELQIQTAGRETAPSLDEYIEQTERLAVTAQTTYTSEFDDVKVEKTIYALIDNSDGSRGTVTLTDDPLPALAGWMLFAAVTSFTGLGFYVVTECMRAEGKTTVSVDGELTKLSGGVSVSCEL